MEIKYLVELEWSERWPGSEASDHTLVDFFDVENEEYLFEHVLQVVVNSRFHDPSFDGKYKCTSGHPFKVTVTQPRLQNYDRTCNITLQPVIVYQGKYFSTSQIFL